MGKDEVSQVFERLFVTFFFEKTVGHTVIGGLCCAMSKPPPLLFELPELIHLQPTTHAAVQPQATMSSQQFQSPEDALRQAVTTLFQHWTALILTVEHQLGGDAKPVHRMVETTIDLAVSAAPRYSSRHLASYFHDEFDRMNTDVDDGSPEQIAHAIINIRDALARSDYRPVTQLLEKHSNSNPSNVVAESIKGLDKANEGDDAMDEGNRTQEEHEKAKEKQQPVVDDDGFMTINKGGRHH